MIKIRFTKQGSNSVIGGFSIGDIARVGEDFARHLVNEAQVAEYVETPAKVGDPEEKPARKAKK